MNEETELNGLSVSSFTIVYFNLHSKKYPRHIILDAKCASVDELSNPNTELAIFIDRTKCVWRDREWTIKVCKYTTRSQALKCTVNDNEFVLPPEHCYYLSSKKLEVLPDTLKNAEPSIDRFYAISIVPKCSWRDIEYGKWIKKAKRFYRISSDETIVYTA